MDDLDWSSIAEEHGPRAILVAVLAFMVWVRARPAVVERVITEDAVFFSGNDPWYHARIIRLTVAHFPATPNFDPWSYYPYGTARHSGFGGLFDQLIALAALLVGGGSPSPHLVDIVTAYAPVFFGAATVVPVYLVARRLTGRWAALISAGLLALASGQFLSRTVVGSADHQSAESLFAAIAVIGFVYMVETVYAEKPTQNDLQDRNWIVLRRPTIASVIAGVAIASYLMLWPQGVMLAFTMGVFVVLQLVRDHLGGRPTEYLAFGTVLTMATAALLTLPNAKTVAIDPSGFSLIQPLVLGMIALGAAVLFGLSEYLNREGYERRTYPIVVTALIGGAIALIAIVYPTGIDMLRFLVVRVYSFGLLTSPSALTVAEVSPATLGHAWRAFGPIFYVAIVGGIIMLIRVIAEDRPIELVVLLWSVTMLSAYFTMIRFGYYLAVNVAIMAGFAIWWTGHRLLRLDTSISDPSDLEAYQIIGAIIILIAVIPGNVVAVGDRAPVWETSNRFGGTDGAWSEELSWVQENTPEVPLDYDRRYAPPDDGDFDYPRGAYGVMSWWDYGHWITFQAHRIPNANPFQQGPRAASQYLQAQTEERANLILDALPALDDPSQVPELSDEDLQGIVEDRSGQQASEETRYVMIDDQMAGGKFGAIATWTGPASEPDASYQEVYWSTQEFQVGGQTARLVGMSDRYRNTMLSRLYFQDARGLAHYRLVHETEDVSTFVSIAQETPSGFQSTNFVHRRLSSEAFATVQQRPDLYFYGVQQASRVKTFERVEGATITGSTDTPNGTPVFATLRLQTNTGRNFTYLARARTDEDGDVSMTVPYATTATVGPDEGGTNSGVTALGNYSLSVGNPLLAQATASADVPEPAIYEGREIQVTFREVERPTGNETNTTTSNGSEGEGTGNSSALGSAPFSEGGEGGDVLERNALGTIAPPAAATRRPSGA